MINQIPILTITIPTYNRPNFIQSQIRKLLPQLDQRVKLVVYDNCSNPSVESYFTDIELEKFTIIKNKVNVGGDANIARCFENCDTKWLWTLSDDDIVKENAVELVLNKIKTNSEVVFLNFCLGLSFETKGFFEFSNKFSSPTVFSSSFTMSSCVYNMEKLQSNLEFYYNNLSSMMGTIILVLKYLLISENGLCKFINETPIGKFNNEVGWNYSLFIKRTKLFIETFDDLKGLNLNKTLFLGCNITNYNLLIIDRKESNVKYIDRWNLFFIAIKNQGIANAFLYSPRIVFRTFFILLFDFKTYYK
jgi:glycosyltransferase involved in cell wall biosynthesis